MSIPKPSQNSSKFLESNCFPFVIGTFRIPHIQTMSSQKKCCIYLKVIHLRTLILIIGHRVTHLLPSYVFIITNSNFVKIYCKFGLERLVAWQLNLPRFVGMTVYLVGMESHCCNFEGLVKLSAFAITIHYSHDTN